MNPVRRLTLAALGLFVLAAQAAAQETRVAAAADADVIAVYSEHVERRLLRAHFDRAAGRVSVAPFGPAGVETFAVAPNGAFVVYSTTQDPVAGNSVTTLVLLDEAGRALGEPLRSPIGAIARLAVSPKGDRIAASSDKGWLVVLAVEGTGRARRLVARAEFGVKADRQFSFAFRPDGGLATVVDDWVVTWRSNDGAVQRTLDLKTLNRDLTPGDQDVEGLFLLNWSPRGDRFAVSWGGGPMITTVFDSAGHRLQPGGIDKGVDWSASKVEFVDGGDAMILYGMQPPALLRLKSLAMSSFGDPGLAVEGCATLAGGHEVALVGSDQIELRSLDGKRLIGPAGLENYSLHVAVPGAKDEVIVAAERGGWVDLYTRQGNFIRRVQSGARENHGFVAASADGATIAALGTDGLGVIKDLRERAWGARSRESVPLVAVAANAGRIVTPGPNWILRSWSRDGAELDGIPLKAAGQVPDRRLSGLAVSPTGDAIAVAEEGAAVWLAVPADKRVLRVALAARSVAPLPDGSGFAVGLADGTVVRLARDGTVQGPPVKAADLEAVQRLVVAPDGQSFLAVEDEMQARHLAWDGKPLTRPYRTSQTEMIAGAFFQDGSPRLILRYVSSLAGEIYSIVNVAPPGERQVTTLEPPR